MKDDSSTVQVPSPTVYNHPKRIFAGDRQVIIDFDPTSYGNCQFDAMAHQLRKEGHFINGVDLRKACVRHIRANIEHYSAFIAGNVDIYLRRMSNNGTYGDHLTIQAISREFGVQFYICSARGPGHDIFLGHYPENEGEHYVSVSSIKSFPRRRTNTNNDHSHISPHSPVGGLTTDNTDDHGNMSQSYSSDSTIHYDIEIQSVTPDINSSNLSPSYSSDSTVHYEPDINTRTTFMDLPPEIQLLILKEVVKDDSSNVFALQLVCK